MSEQPYKKPLFKGMDSTEELQWEELRSMFVGSEKVELERLQQFLEDPETFAREVAKILPSAINISRERSEELTDALTEALRPIIEQAIRNSTERSTQPLSEGLFPIIGPAIRKSVGDMFKRINQNVNSTLTKTFSIQAFKWRMESWRTGKPFMEVVISHTMLYQVKDVFLIHKETGILLQHASADVGSLQDADMVSAMLKAIQDFVRDSFNTKSGDNEIASIEFGEHNIWIEQGPRAILAAVVFGNAPVELRDIFRKSLEKLHIEFSRELREFKGDTEPFMNDMQQVEYCLRQQAKDGSAKTSWTKWILILLIVGSLLGWMGYRMYKNFRWNQYLDEVATIQGVMITAEGREDGKYFIEGFVDPSAVPPVRLMANYGFDFHDVTSKWQYYQPLPPEYVKARAYRLLRPPATVNIDYIDNTLYLKGIAEPEWLDSARQLTEAIWEVKQINADSLINANAKRLEAAVPMIEKLVFVFESGSTNIGASQAPQVRELVENVRNVVQLSQKLKKAIRIEIQGYADGVGDSIANLALSKQRAQSIYNALVGAGINDTIFEVRGYGYRPDLLPNAEPDDKNYRRVELHIK